MAEVTGSLPILVDADAGNIHFPRISSLFCVASHIQKCFYPLKDRRSPVVIGPSINQPTNQSINQSTGKY